MIRIHSASTNERRKGIVLVAVMLVIVLLALAAYRFSELMMAEGKATSSYVKAAKAKSFAKSGVTYASLLLSNPDTFAGKLNYNPWNNPSAFQGIILEENDVPAYQGRFSVVSPLDVSESPSSNLTFRYGATDEAGKINLNGLLKLDSSGDVAVSILTRLQDYVPGMSEALAEAIVDWLDPDDEVRDKGAESATYQGYQPPYSAKNGPLDTLEELLYVEGMTPEILFGNDTNRNGILDPEEDTGDGAVNRGLSAYLTVYSREQNVNSESQPRLFINDSSDMEALYESLIETLGEENEDLAKYLMACRNRSNQIVQLGLEDSPAEEDLKLASDLNESTLGISGGRRRTRQLSSLFALVDTAIAVPSGGGRGRPPTYQYYASPLNDPETLTLLMPLLWDKVTTTQDTDLPARININTAPPAVLATLPGLIKEDETVDEEALEAILSTRPDITSEEAPDVIFETPTWLLSEAGLDVNQMRTLERFITTRTQVYRVQVIGYFDAGGPASRLEAIIDTNRGRPRVVYWRDLTELGRGFNLTQTGQP